MTQQHEGPKATEPKAEKTYVAPKLVHLGSVRELTAGAAGSVDDFALGLKMNVM